MYTPINAIHVRILPTFIFIHEGCDTEITISHLSMDYWTTPNYPENYPEGVECTLTITVTFILKIIQINISCNRNYMSNMSQQFFVEHSKQNIDD